MKQEGEKREWGKKERKRKWKAREEKRREGETRVLFRYTNKTCKTEL